jgi:hypothetical protein
MRMVSGVLALAIVLFPPSLRLFWQQSLADSNGIHWTPIQAAIDGPFPIGTNLAGFPNHKNLSLKSFDKDEQRRKYIRPQELIVMSEEDGVLVVQVTFDFAGPEIESRRILLEIRALDQAGRVLSQASVRCSDARLEAKEVTQLGPVKLNSSSRNSPNVPLEFPVGVVTRVRRVEISLQEK